MAFIHAQLETVEIIFSCPVPNRGVEVQLMHTPITTHFTSLSLNLAGK
jgi:hypothetical protein